MNRLSQCPSHYLLPTFFHECALFLARLFIWSRKCMDSIPMLPYLHSRNWSSIATTLSILVVRNLAIVGKLGSFAQARSHIGRASCLFAHWLPAPDHR